MKTLHRSRQPSGRPTGGQYAAENRAGSGLVLAPEELDHLNKLTETADSAARALAGHRRANQAWDAEDLASDVKMEIVARAHRNGSVTELSNSWVRSYSRGLVARVAEVTRTGRSPHEHYRANSSNMGAFKEFDTRVREFESSVGRQLSESERDAIAAQIRDDWPDRNHRPQEGFHRSIYTGSMDADPESEGAGGLEHVDPAASAEDDYLAGQSMDWAEAEADDDVRNVLFDAKGSAAVKFQWNALCHVYDIPKAPQGVLNNRHVEKVRKTVGSTNEDVLAVCDDWEDANYTERTEEFFRPFGATTMGHQGKVVDLIRSRPGDAAKIFTMALAGATARNFKGPR